MDLPAFKEAMSKLGYTDNVDSLFSIFDADGNGTVDFQANQMPST